MRFMFGIGLVLAVVIACSSSDSGGGGPVSGAQDTHCTGVPAQPVDLTPAGCNVTGGDAGVIDYGDTRYNAEADDDDCKYHLKWTSTDIGENKDVTFNAVATYKTDGGVANGANISIEAFLNTTHPPPNTNQQTTENPPGTYHIGPVRFDAPGQWTIRYHLHENCSDETEDSPHGHVAFFINVP
jgi:hypothetical protein